MLVEYDQPVNYQTTAGPWRPINPALEPDGAGGYQNTAAPFSLDFPGTWSSAAPVTFTRSGAGMSWAVAGMSAASGTPSGQSMTYGGVLPGTSITYTSNATGLGEVVSFADQVSADASLTAPTVTKFDAADRATSVTDPNGNTVTYTYDGWGDKLSETSPSGTTSYTAPATPGPSVETDYAYDAVGNLTSSSADVGDPNIPAYTQSYTYDGLGDVLSTTAPAPTSGSATWSFAYDAADERVQATDPNGRVTDQTYDGLGELASSTTYPSSRLALTTTYAYDADGDLLSGPTFSATPRATLWKTLPKTVNLFRGLFSLST